MWRIFLLIQLHLRVTAVDLFHVEVKSDGEAFPKTQVFQSYMRRADHGDVGASNTDQFRLRLLRDSESKKTTEMAIATHICDAKWAPGAIALAGSLKKTGSTHNLVVMITSDLGERYQRLMAHVFDKVYVEEPVTPHASITRDGADCVTLQLRSWQLPYRKVLYMDADMIALKSHDSILEDFTELSARKDAGLTAQFNGGMFILEPAEPKFQKLRERLRQTQPHSGGHGGIQYFLNEAFPSCQRQGDDAVGCWQSELTEEYNKFTRNVDNTALQANKYASLHYSGDWGASRKPWMSGCLQSSDSVTHSEDETLQSKLLDLWMDAFHAVSVPSELSDLLRTECPAEATHGTS